MTADLRPAYADAVDLSRYPIDDLDSPAGRRLVRACRNELAADGVCSLPGFVATEAIESMVRIAGRLAAKAWASDEAHTVYFEPVDTCVDARHPRAHRVRSAKRGIAYDHIPLDAPIRRLYESDDLTAFIAAVLGREALYRSADPLDAFQITTFEAGDELGWHFDRSAFSVTVMYQQPEGGGHFDYIPRLRSALDENHAGVERALHGDETGIIRLPTGPGTLAVFRGHDALHRVTPVRGGTSRVNSVLTYGEDPGMRLNDLTSELFYGRRSRGPVQPRDQGVSTHS